MVPVFKKYLYVKMAALEIESVQGTIRDNCSHEKIDPVSCVCLSCGVIVSTEYRFSYNNRNPDFEESQMTKGKASRNTHLFDQKSVHELEISQDIIEKAEYISAQFTNIKGSRNKRRLKRQFVCLYFAHHELDIDVDPTDLARRIGLKPKNASSALTQFSPLRTGYTPKIKKKQNHPSIVIAAAHASKLKLTDDAINEIRDIIETVLDVNEKIKNRTPKTIAAAAVYTYLRLNGISVEHDLYVKTINVSETTIKTVSNEIMKAWNT